MARLKAEQWEQARAEYEVRGVSLGDIARSLKVATSSVSRRAKAEGWTQGRMQGLVGRKVAAIKELSEVETQTQADVSGGKMKLDNQHIYIEDADTVTLYVTAATNFVDYKTVNANEGKKASRQLSSAMQKNYTEVRRDHISRYQQQFNRVSLDLGKSEAEQLETTERIARFQEGQ